MRDLIKFSFNFSAIKVYSNLLKSRSEVPVESGTIKLIKKFCSELKLILKKT